MKNIKNNSDSFQAEQKGTEKDQALASKNSFGLDAEYQNEEVKNFFLNLVDEENWQGNFQFANGAFSVNGADCSYRHPFGYLFTNGVKDLAEQNQCFWFIDFIISTTKFSVLPHDFQVWYLLIKDGKKYIICDDGNYNVLVSYKLSFTDFDTYGYTAVKFYLIGDLLLLPEEY